jgi:CCR4-NOT transcription complex subunit 1
MVSPFSPNFSWDKPELSLVPAVNVDFNSALNAGVLMAVDSYLDTRMPHELPMVLPQALKAAESGPGYVTAINALVVYVGMRDCIAVCVDRRVPLAQCPALEIYRQLLRALDVEGRFLVLHAMVDSLRFPNAHTHFFTGVLQVLFLEPDAGLSLQEQIARILLERLVASLPHPWGVIHTFVELVQNHSLLTKPFAQGVPEIERVYRSLVSGGGNMG